MYVLSKGWPPITESDFYIDHIYHYWSCLKECRIKLFLNKL